MITEWPAWAAEGGSRRAPRRRWLVVEGSGIWLRKGAGSAFAGRGNSAHDGPAAQGSLVPGRGRRRAGRQVGQLREVRRGHSGAGVVILAPCRSGSPGPERARGGGVVLTATVGPKGRLCGSAQPVGAGSQPSRARGFPARWRPQPPKTHFAAQTALFPVPRRGRRGAASAGPPRARRWSRAALGLYPGAGARGGRGGPGPRPPAPGPRRAATAGRVPVLPRSRRGSAPRAGGRKRGDAPWSAAGTRPGPPPRQQSPAAPAPAVMKAAAESRSRRSRCPFKGEP